MAVKVSVGLPVYNGEESVFAAIESVLSQSYVDFELIISDNGSTDSTGEICRRFSEVDKRVIYTRQSKNIGAAKNFSFVLEKAQGDYFMWISADDRKSPNFLECNLIFLENNPDYVGSTSPVRFDDGVFNKELMGDFSLDGDVEERFLKFFTGWHANGRFYSLFRRNVLTRSLHNNCFFGDDWAIVLSVLVKGKLKRIEHGWVELGHNGVSQNPGIFKAFRSSWYECCLPFYKLSMFVFQESSGFSIRARILLFCIMIKYNFWANKVRLNFILKNMIDIKARRVRSQ